MRRRSGGLDAAEISALARNLGHPLTKAELGEAMAAMDDDNSGTVEFDEFYCAHPLHSAPHPSPSAPRESH